MGAGGVGGGEVGATDKLDKLTFILRNLFWERLEGVSKNYFYDHREAVAGGDGRNVDTIDGHVWLVDKDLVWHHLEINARSTAHFSLQRVCVCV